MSKPLDALRLAVNADRQAVTDEAISLAGVGAALRDLQTAWDALPAKFQDLVSVNLRAIVEEDKRRAAQAAAEAEAAIARDGARVALDGGDHFGG